MPSRIMGSSEPNNVQSGIDGSIEVQFVDDCAILSINRGDNRINGDFIQKMNQALDKVQRLVASYSIQYYMLDYT